MGGRSEGKKAEERRKVDPRCIVLCCQAHKHRLCLDLLVTAFNTVSRYYSVGGDSSIVSPGRDQGQFIGEKRTTVM